MVLILRESRDNFENREMSHKNTLFGERLRAAHMPPTPQKMTN